MPQNKACPHEKDRRARDCTECKRAWRKKYELSHKDKIRAYRKRTKERFKKYYRKWAKKNRARLRKYRREWAAQDYLKKPKYYRAKWKRTRERNLASRRSTRRSLQARRRTKMAGEHIDIWTVFRESKGTCALCSWKIKKSETILGLTAVLDHITPIHLGGKHVRNNVQLAHYCCNTSKRERMTWDKNRCRALVKSHRTR